MIIGVDIGTRGALALLTPDGQLAEVADMPCLRDGPKRRLRTGAANFSASGLKRQDNDLIVIESAGAAASFKRNFEARFASGEVLTAGAQ
jgi:hypothetical protein